MDMQHTSVVTNGINLHVAQAGPESGPLVILLHGFPEYWAGWRQQIPALAAAGYRVWVPDQRGYNLSDKPAGIAAYNLDQLALDVVGLIDAVGVEKASVVGHDWGAAVAWWLGIKHPQRIQKLAILNVPHPGVLRRRFRTHFSQLRKSWYMFFFQLPWLPEKVMSKNGGERFARGIQAGSPPGAFSEEDVQDYLAAWAQPGAWTGMLNWYRAMFQKPPSRAASYRVTVPVRIIWGKRDAVLEWEMAELSLELCDQGEVVYIDDAAHFVQHDAPARVNDLLLAFLREDAA
ncbi:MAG: alpha/beta hydrolase [Caldilineaceae bacterium]